MIAELHEVLTHQRDAVETLEARLEAIEFLLVTGASRELPRAVVEADGAAERLAALELTRVLTLSSAGARPDISSRELVASCSGEAASSVTSAVDDLRAAVARIATHRDRVLGLLAAVDGDRPTAASGSHRTS